MIGQRVRRSEDAVLVTGRGQFVDDVRLPDVLHACFVRSRVAHGWLRTVDARAAAGLPGVRAVLTGADVAGITLSNARIPGLARTPQPVLARDRVRFVGEAVAMVIAEDRYLANDAAEFVDVEYEELPAILDPLDRPPGVRAIFDGLDGDVVFADEATFGDPAGAFADASHRVTRTFRSSRHVAAPLETRGCLAAYDALTGELRIWSSTQGPHALRRKIAEALAIGEHRIRVFIHDVGGAFGQKIPASPEEMAVAMAAHRLGSPVKWIEDRQENLVAAPHSRDQVITSELAVDRSGRFLGMRARIVGDAGAYSYNAGTALTEPYVAARMLPGPYRIQNYSYQVSACLTNKAPVAPYRGVGAVAAQAARELLIDDVARRLGADRVELRLANLVSEEELPYRTAVGQVFERNTFRECLTATARILEPEARDRSSLSGSGEGRLTGIGYSPYVEATGAGREILTHVYGHPHVENDSARVSLDPSGMVTVSYGTTSQGQGQGTTLAQVAADVLALPIDHVQVSLVDTSSAPLSLTGTRASRSAVVMGGAVGQAAEEIKEKLSRAAQEMLECSAEDLVFDGGRIQVKGSADRVLSFQDVIRGATEDPRILAAVGDPVFSATKYYDPGSAFSNACVGAVVEIDLDTGLPAVKRLVVTHDSGTEINPTIVEGQLAGGMIQGLGTALLEAMVYDPEGNVLTSTFADYLIPSISEMPQVELSTLHTPAPRTWRGIKGVGEGGAIGAPAAIATAVADALATLKMPVDRLPVSPEEIIGVTSGFRPARLLTRSDRGS